MALKSMGDPDNVDVSALHTPMMLGADERAPFRGEWVGPQEHTDSIEIHRLANPAGASVSHEQFLELRRLALAEAIRSRCDRDTHEIILTRARVYFDFLIGK